MKTTTDTKTGIAFSLEQLPTNYAYRYSFQYILRNLLPQPVVSSLIKKIAERLKISVRMVNYYRYVKKNDKGYILDENRLQIIAEELGIDKQLLLADKDFTFKKAS